MSDKEKDLNNNFAESDAENEDNFPELKKKTLINKINSPEIIET